MSLLQSYQAQLDVTTSVEASSRSVVVLTGTSAMNCTALTVTQHVPNNSHMDVDSQSHIDSKVTKHHSTMKTAIKIHQSLIYCQLSVTIINSGY